MLRKFLTIGLISVGSFASQCDTSEACHHRRARHAARSNSYYAPQTGYATVSAGCSGYSNASYGVISGQRFGSSAAMPMSYSGNNTYGAVEYATGDTYGNSVMQSSQAPVNANVNANVDANLNANTGNNSVPMRPY